MPKLFSINIEVEELAVGKVMRQLNAMPGVAKLNLDMERKAKPNGTASGKYQRGQFDVTGEQAIIDALSPNFKMTTAQLKEVYAKGGRSTASVSSVVHKMLQGGDLQRTEDGYALSKKMRDRLRHRKARK